MRKELTVEEILDILCNDIHSAVFASIDGNGMPATCVIDVMLSDGGGIYFLTAKGKSFYDNITKRPYVALTGMKGESTLSATAVSLRGSVKNIGKERLAEIFEKNDYMAKIYPTEKSRQALEVFQLYKAEGEYFDLSSLPPFRQDFAYGGAKPSREGYYIEGDKCVSCRKCMDVCPQNCIEDVRPRVIEQNHCLRCGNCLDACPHGAVIRL